VQTSPRSDQRRWDALTFESDSLQLIRALRLVFVGQFQLTSASGGNGRRYSEGDAAARAGFKRPAYRGTGMLATHKGMNISEQEFMSVIDDAMDALQKNGIDDATRNEVLAVLWSMRREVMRV
jgi:hypothetical protein